MKPVIQLFVFVWLIGFCTSSTAQTVDIRFRGSSFSTTREIIRLQDVAELSGGNAVTRQRLSNLDLEEFGADQPSIEITAELVRYRILLAEIADNQFHIEPATSTTVFHWKPEKINRQIEQLIVAQLTEAYRIPAAELELTLVNELDSALIRAGMDLNSIRVLPRLPTDFPIGQRSIPLKISDTNGKTLDTTAVCRITVYRNVAMANSTITKGQILNESNVESVRRQIDSPSIQLVAYEDAIGKTAQTNLSPYSVVQQQTISDPVVVRTPATSSGVKRNGIVNIVVEHGRLSVSLKNARANQNGQIGEIIPFTNPISNRTIYAKVLDSNTAIIQH